MSVEREKGPLQIDVAVKRRQGIVAAEILEELHLHDRFATLDDLAELAERDLVGEADQRLRLGEGTPQGDLAIAGNGEEDQQRQGHRAYAHPTETADQVAAEARTAAAAWHAAELGLPGGQRPA